MDWRILHAYSKFSQEHDVEESENVFNAMAVLSSAEKDEIDAASKAVRTAHSALHVAGAVTTNRDDLLELMIDIGATYLRDPQAFNDGFDEPLAKISCKLLNLCASFRSYLEHQETYIKQGTGRSSADWIAWRSFLMQIEQDNKYYALVYGLRNYIQHVDMPPVHLSLHSENLEEVDISVDLVSEQLLTPTAKWPAEMREFIGSLGDHISLWEALKSWDEAFQLILKKGIDLRIRPARVAAEFILNVRAKYSVPDYGMLGIAREPAPTEDGRITMNIEWIEERAAAAIIELVNKAVETPVHGSA